TRTLKGGWSSRGNSSRKQSPKPTLYIRTRTVSATVTPPRGKAGMREGEAGTTEHALVGVFLVTPWFPRIAGVQRSGVLREAVDAPLGSLPRGVVTRVVPGGGRGGDVAAPPVRSDPRCRARAKRHAADLDPPGILFGWGLDPLGDELNQKLAVL